jgi:transcriptional regulator with XRE-family HTH domain
MPNRKSFNDQVRQLIHASGQTPYRICQATGVQPATMSRFLNRKGHLSPQSLDALAKYLGWEIIQR